MYRPIKAIQFGGMNSTVSPDLLKESDFRELINWRQVKQGKLVTREGVVLGVYLPEDGEESLPGIGNSPASKYPYDIHKVLPLIEGVVGIGEFILPKEDKDADTDRYMVYAVKLRGEPLEAGVDTYQDDRELRLAFIMVPLTGENRDIYWGEPYALEVPPMEIKTLIGGFLTTTDLLNFDLVNPGFYRIEFSSNSPFSIGWSFYENGTNRFVAFQKDFSPAANTFQFVNPPFQTYAVTANGGATTIDVSLYQIEYVGGTLPEEEWKLKFDPTFFTQLPHWQAERSYEEDKTIGYSIDNQPRHPEEWMGSVKLMSEDNHFVQMTMFANKLIISDPVNGDMLLQWRDLKDKQTNETTFTYALTANTLDRFNVNIVEVDNQVEVGKKNAVVNTGMGLYKYKLKDGYYKHTEDHFNNRFGFVFGTNIYDNFGNNAVAIEDLDPNADTKGSINQVATIAGVAASFLGIPFAVEAAQAIAAIVTWLIGDGDDIIDQDRALPVALKSIRERMEDVMVSNQHVALFTAAIYSRLAAYRVQQGDVTKFMHRGHRYSSDSEGNYTLIDIMKDNGRLYTFTNALKNAFKYDDLLGDLEFPYDEFERTFLDDDGIQRSERVREKAADVYIWDDYKIDYYPCSGKKESGIGYQYAYARDIDFDKTTPLQPRIMAFDKATGRALEVPVGTWQYRFVWDYGNNEYSAPSTPLVIPDLLFSAVPDNKARYRKLLKDGYVDYFNAVEENWVITRPTVNPVPPGRADYRKGFLWAYGQGVVYGWSDASNNIIDDTVPPSLLENLDPEDDAAEIAGIRAGYADGYSKAQTEFPDGWDPISEPFPQIPFNINVEAQNALRYPPELEYVRVTPAGSGYPEIPLPDENLGVTTSTARYERYFSLHNGVVYAPAYQSSISYDILTNDILFTYSNNNATGLTDVGKSLYALKRKLYVGSHRFNPIVWNGTTLVGDKSDHADFATLITLYAKSDEMPLNGVFMAGADLDFWDSNNIQPYKIPLVVPILPTNGAKLNSIATLEGRLRFPFTRTAIRQYVNEAGERQNYNLVRPNKAIIFAGMNTVFDRNRKVRTSSSNSSAFESFYAYNVLTGQKPETADTAFLESLSGEGRAYLTFWRNDWTLDATHNNNAIPFDSWSNETCLIPLFTAAAGGKSPLENIEDILATTTFQNTNDDNNTASDDYDKEGLRIYDTHIRVVKSIADELSVVNDETPSEVVDRLILSGVAELQLVEPGERMYYNTEYRYNPPSWCNGNSHREGDMRLIREDLPSFNGVLARNVFTHNAKEPFNMKGFNSAAVYSIPKYGFDTPPEKMPVGGIHSDSGLKWHDYSTQELRDTQTAEGNTIENMRAILYMEGQRFIGVEQLTSYFPASLLFKAPRFSLHIDKKDIPQRAKRLLVFRTLSTNDNSYEEDKYGLVVSLKVDRSTGELPYKDESETVIAKDTPVYYDDDAACYREGIYFFDDVKDSNLNFVDDVNRYEGLTEPLKSKYNISIDNRMVFANYTETYQPPTPRGGHSHG